jgi:hypothetical protein
MTTTSTRGLSRRVGLAVAALPIMNWNRTCAGDARHAINQSNELVTSQN